MQSYGKTDRRLKVRMSGEHIWVFLLDLKKIISRLLRSLISLQMKIINSFLKSKKALLKEMHLF